MPSSISSLYNRFYTNQVSGWLLEQSAGEHSDDAFMRSHPVRNKFYPSHTVRQACQAAFGNQDCGTLPLSATCPGATPVAQNRQARLPASDSFFPSRRENIDQTAVSR